MEGGVGNFLVLPLRLFNDPDDDNWNNLKIQRVKELYHEKGAPYAFPLRAQYDRNRREIHVGDEATDLWQKELDSYQKDGENCPEPLQHVAAGGGSSSSTGVADSVLESNEPMQFDFKTWQQTDVNAKRFTIPNKDGPQWASVVQRITFDRDAHEEIANESVKGMSYNMVTRPLDKPRNLTTLFFYEETSPLTAKMTRASLDLCFLALPVMNLPQG